MSDVAFLEAIRAQPDDDAVRLIYADWLMDRAAPAEAARGEFIRLHVENRDRPRQEALARAYLVAWWQPFVTLLGDAAPWWVRRAASNLPLLLSKYRRGFVWLFDLPASSFLARAAALREHTPVSGLVVTRWDTTPAALFASPHLAEIETLGLGDIHQNPLDADGARVLARSAQTGRLRELMLYHNNLGDRGAVALAEAPWLSRIRRLSLAQCGLGADGVTALANADLRGLRYLMLSGNVPGTAGMTALAHAPWLPNLHTLDLSRCGIDDAQLDVLLSADLSGLRVLLLRHNSFARSDADLRAALPQLETATLQDGLF